MKALNRKQIRAIFEEKNIEPTREIVNNNSGDITFFKNEKEIALWQYQTKELTIK